VAELQILVGDITGSISRPFTPPAALISSMASRVPRG
jgi:hypothetical protein